MLLKHSQDEKKPKANGAGKQQRGAGTMKLIVGTPLPPRPHRRSAKGFGAKRPAVPQPRTSNTGGREIRGFGVDPCENSNDSGLGFDHHLDYPLHPRSTLKVVEQESWSGDHPETKRKKLDIKLESEDARDNFGFSETMSRGRKDMHIPGSLLASAAGEAGRAASSASHHNTGGIPRAVPRPTTSRPLALTSSRNSGPVSLSTQLTNVSHDGRTHLQIICQPEQQHRARYQTEGSRGAVKDRSGNGFPIVKLVGYNKPAVMQVFIGTDVGRVAPHMFYQACRVSGKNSTPCVERKIDGTIVIEVDFDPAKEMIVTCDCVGILKERNVDVEHRFPDQSGTRNKKKSTRCRMIFRTTITHDDGSTEVLQAASQPIVCTQPPGVPEIGKKSLMTCVCTGGEELFILGKNFLKDTRVLFQNSETDPTWEESVQPNKEYLQQTHLVCKVPPYRRVDISEPVTVKLLVMSSGKTSEPHTFTYLPTTNPVVAAALQAPAGATHLGPSCVPAAHPEIPAPMELSRGYGTPNLSSSSSMRLGSQQIKSGTDFSNLKNQFMPFGNSRGSTEKDVHPVMMWQSPSGTLGKEEKKQTGRSVAGGVKMMPMPPLLPLVPRRTSGVEVIIPDMHVPEMKTEVLDESSQNSTNQLSPEDLKGIDLRTKPVTTVGQLGSAADLSGTPSPSMTTFQRFVSRDNYLSLPSQTGQSVEKYLSHLEGGPNNPKDINQQISSYKMANSSSTNTSTSAVSCQGLSGEKSLAQFSSQPLMFDNTQQNLLTSRHIVQQKTSQKIDFVGDIALSSLYEQRETSDKPDERHKSPVREDVIVRAQSVEESVSQSQSLQEALSQTQTLQEAFNQSQTLQEAFNQSQTLQKTFTQPQTLQEAITHSQSLQEALTQTQSLQEAMVQSQSISEVITQNHSMQEAVAQQQTLQQAVTAAQTLQEAVAQSQSIQQAIAGSQPLQDAVTHSQALQEAIAQNQLIALSNLTSTPISNLCNQQANVALTSRNHISEVQGSQVNDNRAAENYHSNTLQGTASETPMNIPEMINALPESRVLMQAPTSIVFRSHQESITRDTVCMDTKSDEQMMDSMNNNLESGPLSAGSCTTASGHSSPVLNVGNGVLSIEAPTPPSDRGIGSREQPSLISTAGLEALVSSAMETHITSATEKLDAIVNSAADSHMANQNTSVTSVSDILNSRVSVELGDGVNRGDTQQSAVLADTLRLESSINAVRELSAFNISSLQTGQQPVQLTQESIMLNNAVSAAIDEHLRRQDAEQKDSSVADRCTVVNTTLASTSSGLSIITPSTTDSILLKSPHISPIVVKKMMLDNPVSVSVDGSALVTSANNSPPIAVKHITLNTQPSEPEIGLSSSNITSPTVTESNIHIQVPECSTIAVKDIINSHTRAIESSNTVISPSLNANNSRVDILETNSCLQAGTAVEMHADSLSSLLNSNNNSTLVTDSQIQSQTLAVTQSSSLTSESLQSPTCLTNGRTQLRDVQSRNELGSSSHEQPVTAATNTAEPVMVQHSSLLNSIYAAAADSTNVNYSTRATMLTSNPVEGCPVTVAQIASLNSIAHSTAEIVQNATLQTDVIPSKAVEGTDAHKSAGTYLLIGLPANEKEQLQTPGGQPPAGCFSVTEHKTFNPETKPEEGNNLSNFSRPVGTLECREATNQQHKVPTVTSLPVPVAEISSATTQAKGLVTSSTAPKKCEEGMVPQELTQMSESDLISYINPSCFDQGNN